MTLDRKRDAHPESALQAVLSSACYALDVDSVDPQDDFFALGGSSLEAVTLCYELEKRGYSLELADIFEATSFGELASSVKVVEEDCRTEPVDTED